MSSDASDPIWGSLLLQVILILINAFFAMTELAVISLNDNKIRKQAEEGDKKSKQLLRLVDAPSSFLSTIQIGITLAGFLASAFAASNFAQRIASALRSWGVTFLSESALSTICVILITLILSYFTLIFGELVPKRIAMKNPERVANFAGPFILVLATVMKPIVALLAASTNLVLRLIGIDPKNDGERVTEEEIRMMVDIGEEKGAIEAGEAELIDNIFEFNNSTAADVMVHRKDMTALCIRDSRDEILQTILDTGFSRFPVFDEDVDDIVGILSTREFLLDAQSKQPHEIKELLRAPYLVPETVHADVLFREMQKKKVHMAIVLDEYGGTSGIVTMEDLLEEIVGDIYDEFDKQQELDITKLEENLWRINGGVDLETINDTLDVDLPLDEEFDTLGGLVYSCLTSIPEDGSTPCVDAFGLHIQVERLEDRRVESALVSKLPPETPAPEDAQEEEK